MNLIKRNSIAIPSIIDELFKPDWFGGYQSPINNNVPAVNIKESDTHFDIEVAAPGKSKDDFSIEIDHQVLTISSEKKSETEEKDSKGNYTRREFSYSSFRRSFTLPESVNSDSIKAIYENGILNVTLPKKEEALPKPKRLIEIA